MTRTESLKLILLAIWTSSALTVDCAPTSLVANAVGIRSVTVNGNPVQIRRNGSVDLGSSPKNIMFTFGPGTNSEQVPLRIRYRLEGYENDWHDYAGEMSLTIRFHNNVGDIIGGKTFGVNSESAGWNGSLITSTLIHRRETLVVPIHASKLMVVISSAGPPEAVGIYVVANLVVSKSSDDFPPVILLQSPFDQQSYHEKINQPNDWIPDGIHPSMAKIVEVGQFPAVEAFAIFDDDPIGHAEWHNTLDSAPKVTPGDRLVVEWNEMYSIGAGGFNGAPYGKLTPGEYMFHIEGTDILGMPTGVEASLTVLVPQPFWRMPWFWSVTCIVIIATAFGSNRYVAWHRMRREMSRLENQQALERDRLRIAHDIHDDLGARVTQISLLSAMSQNNPLFPDKARADFDEIYRMSRELVSALYETVWAVNPENDNLDALGNYLCQMVNQLCEQSQVRCRFHLSDLPQDVQMSSQKRHNISMVVKEAIHNVIKHANATEVIINGGFKGNMLEVSIGDNGRGFKLGENPGNGLTNMKRRMEDIGGHCSIESQLGKGTVVCIRLTIRPMDNFDK